MSKKKQERLKCDRMKAYQWEMLSMISSMFDYSMCPDEFRSEFLEWSLLRFGYAAIAKKDGRYYVGYLSWYDYDEYGLPKGQATFWTRKDFSFDVEIGKDCIIGYNNNIRTPEVTIEKYAEMFTEIDTSIKTQVLKSRLCPIPVADDEKIKTALENILQDIELGSTKIIGKTLSPKDLLQGEASKPVEMISLTEPDQIAKVQYLSQLWDDTLKRVSTFYGHALNGVNKRAQVNSDELKGFDTFSMIYPQIMYKARQEMLEECNRVFGTDWSVTFSKAFEHLNETPEERMEEENEPERPLQGEEGAESASDPE